MQPEKRWNTPKELEELEEFYNSIDRAALPASFDARKSGIILSIFFKKIEVGPCTNHVDRILGNFDPSPYVNTFT